VRDERLQRLEEEAIMTGAKMTVDHLAEQVFAILSDKALDDGDARTNALVGLESRSGADRQMMAEALKIAEKKLGEQASRSIPIDKLNASNDE
jgi:hypothetical protein